MNRAYFLDKFNVMGVKITQLIIEMTNLNVNTVVHVKGNEHIQVSLPSNQKKEGYIEGPDRPEVPQCKWGRGFLDELGPPLTHAEGVAEDEANAAPSALIVFQGLFDGRVLCVQV